MKKRILFLMVVLFIVIALKGNTQTHNVPSDYESIQLAIDASDVNDTIILQNGTYSENIVIDKPLIISSLYEQTHDTLDIENTIIDGGQLGTVITIINIEEGDVFIQGIRIKNGSGTLYLHPELSEEEENYYYHGGGFFIQNANHVHLINMWIEENNLQSSNSGAGGLLADNSQITILNSKIRNNAVKGEGLLGEGAGLWFFSSDVNITNSQICGNLSTGLGEGQGLYIKNGNLIMESTRIYDNGGANSSGLHSKSSELYFFLCEFSDNLSVTGGTIYIKDTVNSVNSAVFESCSFFNNDNWSGGIICGRKANVSVNDCDFFNNRMGLDGGAVNAFESVYSISNSRVVNNFSSHGSSQSGVGLFSYHSDGVVDSVDFFSNSSINGPDHSLDGGAIKMINSSLVLRNSHLENNTAYNGGVIYVKNSNLIIERCLLAKNNAVSGGAIYSIQSDIQLISSTITANSSSEGSIRIEGDDLVSVNTVLWNEDGNEFYTELSSAPSVVVFDHSDIRGFEDNFVNSDHCQITWVAGNVSEEPLFEDEENGNYKLSNESPLIDAGTAYFEHNGQIMIDLGEDEYNGLAPDMGVYEKGNPVGINFIIVSDLDVYPNPMMNSIFLNTDKEILKIQIYNINGILVKENWGSKYIGVQDLLRGVYVLKAFDLDKIQYNKKLIKN